MELTEADFNQWKANGITKLVFKYMREFVEHNNECLGGESIVMEGDGRQAARLLGYNEACADILSINFNIIQEEKKDDENDPSRSQSFN